MKVGCHLSQPDLAMKHDKVSRFTPTCAALTADLAGSNILLLIPSARRIDGNRDCEMVQRRQGVWLH